MNAIRRLIQSLLVMVLLAPLACPPSPGPAQPLRIELETVASGLVSPVYLTDAGDGSGRLFVVDQIGLVRVISSGQLAAEPFLDIRSRLVSLSAGGDERGLLGLAFHPGFADAASPGFGRLYTYQSEPPGAPADFTVPLPAGAAFDHQDVLTEWQVGATDPNRVDPSSSRDLLRSDHPQSNHNGGQLAFGPDGQLYIGIGDGGAGNDSGPGHSPQGNAQDTGNLLGKILRIDPLPPGLTSGAVGPASGNGQYRVPADNPFVSGGGLGEIFAYGLRNPYRFSFDSLTGELIVGDVGQNAIEEVDAVIRGGNYGWPIKEGAFLLDRQTGTTSTNSPGQPAGLIDPILQYDHSQGRAVIGGFVYRGQAIDGLAGQYVFGDLTGRGLTSRGQLLRATPAIGSEILDVTIGLNDRTLGLSLKGFGQDAQGELYVLGSAVAGPIGTSGTVLRIVPLLP
jgi:glucose/arabinose dehydrogenase